MSTGSVIRPRAVTLAAILLGLLMVWRFGLSGLPGLLKGTVSLWTFLDDVPALIFWLVVVWGLLALQRWAWWLSIVFGALLAGGGFVAMYFVDELQRHVPETPRSTVLMAAALVGATAAVAWCLLMLPASRKAFSDASASQHEGEGAL